MFCRSSAAGTVQRMRIRPCRRGKRNSGSRARRVYRRRRNGRPPRSHQGKTVRLGLADVGEFSINGVTFSSAHLGNRFHRCMLENLLLSLEQATPHGELLNKFVDPMQKIERKIDKLPPKTRRRVIRNLMESL